VGSTAQFNLGVFCCSSIGIGWFNAYAHAAQRDDLDLLVHVGDYIYEYGLSPDPQGRRTQPARDIDPSDETITLADYRLRYALYRRDPDLLALHARYPMVAQWDDHELANDAWQGGAQNHDEDEGDWSVRRDAAIQAYRDWMPVSDANWNQYQIGDLATLFKVETRITGRSQQLDMGAALEGRTDIEAALREFRDGPWRDPARSMMGADQEQWLANAFAKSTRNRTRWQVLAQQTVMGDWLMAPEVADWVGGDRAQRNLLATQLGLPWSMDSWSGYPAARDRLLRSALQANANLIVLSGDSHNAWGQNLTVDRTAAGAEFAGQAVTSGGMDGMFARTSPTVVSAALLRAYANLLLSEVAHRGYMSVHLTPQQARCDWHFFNTVRQRDTSLAETRRLQVLPGRRAVQQVG
jgi:alkaline phosphatase D